MALEEARRSFDALSAELPTLRTRATQVLGLAGLAASFLGGLALRPDQRLSAWGWVAIGAFVVTAVLSAMMLWPRRFYASPEPAVLVGWAERGDLSTQDATRDLALRYGEKYDANRRVMDRLSGLYAAAVISVCLEILALVLDLWSS